MGPERERLKDKDEVAGGIPGQLIHFQGQLVFQRTSTLCLQFDSDPLLIPMG